MVLGLVAGSVQVVTVAQAAVEAAMEAVEAAVALGQVALSCHCDNIHSMRHDAAAHHASQPDNAEDNTRRCRPVSSARS